MSAVGDEDTFIQEEVEPELGSSVHPMTKKAYNDLGLQVPDSVHLAALRPYEQQKRQVQDVLRREGKGEELEIKTKVNAIYRVKNTKKQEFFCVLYQEQIKDLMGNPTAPAEYSKGTYRIPKGNVIRNNRFEITRVEMTGMEQIFDIPWSTKEVDRWVAKHEKSGYLKEDINLYIGNASTNTRGWISGMTFAIKNLEDFKQGTFEQLMQLGQRGLSTMEPSLDRLKQPISDDPADSIPKKKGLR